MWAIISGASSGIGVATASALAAKKYNLILLARREERLRALSVELSSKYKIHCEFAGLDLRRRTDVEEWIDENSELLPQVEVLVNNAGLAKGTEKIQEASVDDWEEMIDVNVKGVLYLTRGVVPHMVSRNSGHIVNLGSVAGRWVYPGGGVYCATKFAIRALSEGLRQDLLGSKIRVTNIEPGMVETEFSIVRLGDGDRAKKVYSGMTPLKPEDIADSIVWCLDRPGHVNIQELVIYPTDQASVYHVARK